MMLQMEISPQIWKLFGKSAIYSHSGQILNDFLLKFSENFREFLEKISKNNCDTRP